MIRFIDMHRDQFGVELVYRVMRDSGVEFVSSRGYRAAKTWPVSARMLRDSVLVPEFTRLHRENYGVYGVCKIHALMKRQGWTIATTLQADILSLQALDMAVWDATRYGADLAGLVHHADHSSNYLSVVYTD